VREVRRELHHGLFARAAFTLWVRPLCALDPMLLLTAILHIWLPREAQAHDLLAERRGALGHVALTVIALVYVLVEFWQRA
jgi:hypothetical protein